jgi:UDP-N-acetylmuramyl pentapeptide phosphotransferase/UDP-N-acetylglucosamine-1-phosphate transferase
MTILILLFVSFMATAVLLAALGRLLPTGFLAAAVTSRSNHSGPARQIGGIAAAPVAIIAVSAAAFAGIVEPVFAGAVAASAALLAVLGFLDDRRDLGAGAKLAGQFAAAILLLWHLEPGFRVLPDTVPLAGERALLAVAVVWWVNMTNFMDGLDLMMVAGIGVPHAILALAGAAGLVDAAPAALSAGIAGALLGFALFNLPPAKIFLGDSGSLALGLLSGAVVLLLAERSPWAALLPFAFFLADSVSTIVMRGLRGEDILGAHSAHAYQVARRAGRPVRSIVAEVAMVGGVASALAIFGFRCEAPFDIAAFALGGSVAAASVYRMRRQASAAKG